MLVIHLQQKILHLEPAVNVYEWSAVFFLQLFNRFDFLFGDFVTIIPERAVPAKRMTRIQPDLL